MSIIKKGIKFNLKTNIKEMVCIIMATNLKKQIILRQETVDFHPMNRKMSANFEASISPLDIRNSKPLDSDQNKAIKKITRLSIEVAELSPKETFEAQQDPKNIVVPAMPISLIKPFKITAPYSEEKNLSNTWGVETTLANKSQFNGEGVKIAILDTGINAEHVAFQGMQLKQRNFTQDVDEDNNGHGTHCAGTIFGRNVNGLRIGVAPGITEALIAKVIGVGGTSGSLIKAMLWAHDEGANLISMSLGIDFTTYIKELIEENYTLEAATSYALEQYLANVNLFSTLNNFIQTSEFFSQPCTIIAASGNSSNRPEYAVSASVPATSEHVISVGALAQIGETFTIARFSNQKCSISAPGVKITSAWNDSTTALKTLDGTSMAAPHVAGCAALWIQKLKQEGNFSSKQVLAELLGNAKTIPTISGIDIGSGLVQAPL